MILVGLLALALSLAAGAQQGGTGQVPVRADLDQMMQVERQDLGVAPTNRLHRGPMHGPTPASIPGGQVVTTKGLIALSQGGKAPFIVFDVLGQPEILPGAVPAVWLAQPGTFDDQVQRQASQMLSELTRGRKDTPLVFYCLSRECWMSYNAALRAIHAGYTNVLWYRGGIEAWKWAGLPTQLGQQAQARQPDRPPQGRTDDRQTKFVPVEPLARESGGGGELRIGQGRHFSFALPPEWRVGEDGQFALTLHSPDNKALTVMVGNAGLPPNYPPGQFAYERLSAMQPQGLRLGEPRQARPAAGFAHAVEFDVSYRVQGASYQGVAKVSLAPAYDSATMAMTAALSVSDQWSGYSSWLPQVADQIAATDGAAFGMRGLMQQNLRNSVAYGEAARQYRAWSQDNWRQVTDERERSQDRRNLATRENLGGIQTFTNPYETNRPVELPMTSKYYWTDRDGRIVGTDDPGADPNTGSTGDWRRMERVVR